MTTESLRESLEDTFWERHANPKSGWSRTLIGPLLLLGLYRRSWRIVCATVLATVLNPVLFSRADPETDSWMTRGVRAERWWLETDGEMFGLDWPNVLNTCNVPVFAYAVYAAYTRKPGRAATAWVVSALLKLGWVEAIAQRYDRASDEAATL